MIYELPTTTPTKLLFDRLKWVKLVDRVHYGVQSLHDMTPTYMKDRYT